MNKTLHFIELTRDQNEQLFAICKNALLKLVLSKRLFLSIEFLRAEMLTLGTFLKTVPMEKILRNPYNKNYMETSCFKTFIRKGPTKQNTKKL